MSLAHLVSPPCPKRRLARASREPRTMVTVCGVELAVHDGAPGSSLPVIVCLHAIGHGGRDFVAFEDAFSREYRVVTVDWPGQGASGDDAHPASATRYRTLLAALVDRLDLGRFVLVGNSIGGAISIGYAADHPSRVRALVLANPGGLDPGGLVARLFIGHLVRRFRAGTAGRASFGAWFARYYARILVTGEATAAREAIVASAYEIAPRLEEAWTSFAQPDADLRSLIPRVTMPVLFAWASEDRLIRFARNRAAIESFPDRRVVQFRAGHSPFLETPAAFNAAVATFLGELPKEA